MHVFACLCKITFQFGEGGKSRPFGYVLVIAKQFFRLLIGNLPSIFTSTFV